ncbi:low affinity iron permease family protein [Xanthobacteraceae bacterium A53D]
MPQGKLSAALHPSMAAGPANASPARPLFTRISQAVSKAAGKPVTFIAAAGIIVVWALTGPLFGYNDTWQLIINTSTTIVTFLMVFLIQNSQNRDTAALQIKLDELIARLDGPRNVLLDLEELDEKTLERLRGDYEQLAGKARGTADEGAQAEPAGRTIADICACPAGGAAGNSPTPSDHRQSQRLHDVAAGVAGRDCRRGDT